MLNCVCVRCAQMWEKPPTPDGGVCACGGALHEAEMCIQCGKTYYRYSRSCGAWICLECGDHLGLARCFCGWSETSPGNGRRELVEMGETIDED